MVQCLLCDECPLSLEIIEREREHRRERESTGEREHMRERAHERESERARERERERGTAGGCVWTCCHVVRTHLCTRCI